MNTACHARKPIAFATADSEQHAGSEGWRAAIRLGFRKARARTVLAERSRRGPLAVQRALYPEADLCHVYLLHPPGGVAGGDTLDIEVRVARDAAALITTPGATKFYRSVGPRARQHQSLHVDGGSLEWLPQENILFPGAKVELSTEVWLSGDAAFIGWEINCLGRPAVGERFAPGRAVFRYSLYRDGLPLLHERLLIEDETCLRSHAGLRNQPVFGSLYATFDDAGVLEEIRESLADEYTNEMGISVMDGLLIARYLGLSSERARHCFNTIWQRLRPAVVRRAPCPPRIWNT